MSELASTSMKRVWHHEYGRGSVLSVATASVIILWDKPQPGSYTRQLVHDRSFVAQLQEVPELDSEPWPELRPSDTTNGEA